MFKTNDGGLHPIGIAKRHEMANGNCDIMSKSSRE